MQKLYYSISEISKLVEEEQHILRYWEKEFIELKPKKNRAGNRIFSEKDLFIIKAIKKLIRKDKLSLNGAKEQLIKILYNLNDETLFASDTKPVEIPDVIKNEIKIETLLKSDEKIININDLKLIRNELKEILIELQA